VSIGTQDAANFLRMRTESDYRARLFTGSFESAIYLLSSICAVPGNVSVIPSLNSNFAHHIAAGLEDGSVITGQNNISHPSKPTAAVPVGQQRPKSKTWSRMPTCLARYPLCANLLLLFPKTTKKNFQQESSACGTSIHTDKRSVSQRIRASSPH
jgi:hypothetical protein